MDVTKVLAKLKDEAQGLASDPQKLLGFLDKVSKKSSSNSTGPMKDLKSDLERAGSMLRDYATGRYRKVPWTSILSLIGGLIYFLNPFDFVPDFIPLKGLVDDATILIYVLHSIKGDLDQYQEWRDLQD